MSCLAMNVRSSQLMSTCAMYRDMRNELGSIINHIWTPAPLLCQTLPASLLCLSKYVRTVWWCPMVLYFELYLGLYVCL